VGLIATLAIVAAQAQAPAPPAGASPAPDSVLSAIPPSIDVAQADLFDSILQRQLGPLPADAPQASADPRNLEGTWFHDQNIETRIGRDMYGRKLPFSRKGQSIRDRRLKATYIDQSPNSNASAECRPPGLLWQTDLNFPFQIFQTKSVVAFVFEEYHGLFNVRMDPRAHAPAAREYMGTSQGHWDGDTLVIETRNFKRALWLDVDGAPLSKDGYMVHRIRKIDSGTPKLEIVTTVHDSEMYTAPWSVVRTFAWRPDKVIFGEYNCEYQVGAPGGISRYGLVPEPNEE
jgi:hypothetical protein